MKQIEKIKRAAALVLVMFLLAGLSSCGNTAVKNNADGTADAATRIVTDCVGRKVEIPDHVERIACLYAFAGHVTAMLGQSDKIVAVVDGMKRDVLLTSMFPSILNADVPYTAGSINIEELVKTDPDVVFVRESTYNTDGEMKKLEAFDLPVVVVDSNTIEEQRKAVEVVGEVCGGKAVEKARAYDKFFQEAIDTAEQKSKRIKPKDAVSVYHSINEATRTDMENTLPAQWMDIVGVKNVSVGRKLSEIEGKTYASLEQIYLWDPQIIICNEPGVSNYIMSDSKWAELKAVKNKTVYQMPIGISRWGHPGSAETPLAIYWLGKLVYPELYKDISVEEKATEFYKTFFDYDLTKEDLSDMMAGKGMRLANKAPQQ